MTQTIETIQSKIEAFKNDPKAVAALKNVETPAELAELFNKYGIECTVEDCEQLVETMFRRNGDELNESELENVSGGSFFLGLCITAFALGGLNSECGKLRNWFRTYRK